jgi:hypothetical protein
MTCSSKLFGQKKGVFLLMDISMITQNECIIWFKNINVKVLHGSLIVQHIFDTSTTTQCENIIWFKNINLIKVLQGSLIILQHIFNIFVTIQSEG